MRPRHVVKQDVLSKFALSPYFLFLFLSDLPSLIHNLNYDQEKLSSSRGIHTVYYIFEPNKKVPVEQYIPKNSSLNQSWADLRHRSWYNSFVNPFELYSNLLNYDKWTIWYYVFCNKSLSKRVLFWVELDVLKLSSLDQGWCSAEP